MIIIGENINATRKSVSHALKSRDSNFISSLAKQQAEAGTDFIDVNAGSGYSSVKEKLDSMQWLVETVQTAVELPLVIDSDEPEVIQAALQKYKGEKVLINSLTAEKEKLESIGNMTANHNAWIVGLATGESGIPKTVKERLNYCQIIFDNLTQKGLQPESIFFDPLVIPASVDQDQARVTLETITAIKNELPGARTVMGLSNVSFGLPARRLINRSFLAMAAAAGLDAVILDPLDTKIMSAAKAADVLTGHDKWCRKYSRAHRKGTLDS